MIKLKSTEEIKRIRESCRLLARAHLELGKLVEEGFTTAELDKVAYHFITKNGGKPAFLHYMGYPATLCTSVNDVVIHGIPGKEILKNGDVVSLDLGINLKGFFSDSAVTHIVGTGTEEAQNLVKRTRECLYLGIDQAKVGNRVHDISRAVFKHAKQFGYGVVRDFCGHGVGFAPHEDPQVPNYVSSGPNPRFKAGMVVAIEPMINLGTDDVKVLPDGWTVKTLDRKISAHWEHTVAIFKDHTEVLTIPD